MYWSQDSCLSNNNSNLHIKKHNNSKNTCSMDNQCIKINLMTVSTPSRSNYISKTLKVGEFTKARIVRAEGHDLVAQPF